LIRRSVRGEFQVALEAWINEIVANNADGHNDAIPGMIKQSFDESMKANTEYHLEMANSLDGNVDKTLAKYHCLTSDNYKRLLCK
jgi:hypothetical protein